MAGVELGFMAPHPWIMVAGEREEGHHSITTSAFRRAAAEVANFDPDVMLVASPHWMPMSRLRIGGAPRYTGTLAEFLPHINEGLPPEHRRDLPPVPYDFPGDPELAARLHEAGEAAGLPVYLEPEPKALDHGSMVPILYLNPEGRFPVLLLSIEEGPKEQSRKWGEIIGREVARAGRRAVFVSSGTLSHHFVFDSADALWAQGEAWDRRLMDRISVGDSQFVFGLSDGEIAEGELEAGGLHGLYMMFSAWDAPPAASVLSYEGIVGVGSPIIRFDPAQQEILSSD